MGQYWEQRSIDLEKLIQDRNDKTIIKVNTLFDSTFNKLDSEILRIFSKFASDSKLTTAEALTLLNTKQTAEERKRLKAIYNEIQDEEAKQEVLNRLNAPAYASRISRIEALKNTVFCEAQLLGYQEKMLLEQRLIDSYEQTYYRSTFNIQKGTGLAYDFNKLSNPAVKSALAHKWEGGNYSSRVWNDTQDLATKLEKVVEQGLLTGSSITDMTTALMGCMDSGRYVANRLIRTEVAYISGQARKKSYEEAEIDKYIFIATLDLKTSAICRSLDGKVFNVIDIAVGVNFPPMHPHCRSTDGAYIEGKDRSRLERRAKNPETGKTMTVPKTMNYEEWYDKFVKGNKTAKANEKKIKNKYTDLKQHELYREVLGRKVPKDFDKFQDIKYKEPGTWKEIKQQYREVVKDIN